MQQSVILLVNCLLSDFFLFFDLNGEPILLIIFWNYIHENYQS